MQNIVISTRNTSLYGSQTSPVVVCMKNSLFRIRMTSPLRFQPTSVVLCLQYIDFRTRHTSLYASQTSSVVFSTHNSVLSSRIKRLYWFQPSSVALFMQNSVISTWITSLYGSQHSSVVFACKTTPFGPESQVSMCPRHHQSFCAWRTA